MLVVLGIAVAIVVLGFVMARKAGRGSAGALVWWGAILVLEGLYVLGSVAALLDGQFSLLVLLPVAVVAGQVAVFLQARKETGR